MHARLVLGFCVRGFRVFRCRFGCWSCFGFCGLGFGSLCFGDCGFTRFSFRGLRFFIGFSLFLSSVDVGHDFGHFLVDFVFEGVAFGYRNRPIVSGRAFSVVGTRCSFRFCGFNGFSSVSF